MDQESGKRDSSEGLVPSTMKDCCYAQCCSYVTLLKSTLLPSLLTPALDGLLSTPLFPSRLVGTECGDTIGPSKIKIMDWQERQSTDGHYLST